MGLLRKAIEYIRSMEYVSNAEMQELANWYARGLEPLGEPITEEEADKRIRESIDDIKHDFPDFVEKNLESFD